jgi:beta-glucosidase
MKLNEKRFLSLDFNYGRRVNSEMFRFLLTDNGMREEKYDFFLREHLKS